MPDYEYFKQRPSVNPTIYAYCLEGVESHKGCIKVGYTDRDADTRIREQLHTSAVPYKILYTESAMCPDGSCFTDHDVHAILKRNGFRQLNKGEDRNEWFFCTVNDVRAAINELKSGETFNNLRTENFKMRPEQTRAVMRTMEYYDSARKDDPTRAPKFLWNAKMRFGKTLAAYQLCKKMSLRRILVLTFKPAVESAWHKDLQTHINFEGWQFISNKDAKNNNIDIDRAFRNADKSKPMVVFGSFQDLLGTNENGGIKAKNEFIHTEVWDIVIFDEYHFGAWRENAKKLFENPDEEADADFDAEKYQTEEAGNAYNETFLPISTSYYLNLLIKSAEQLIANGVYFKMVTKNNDSKYNIKIEEMLTFHSIEHSVKNKLNNSFVVIDGKTVWYSSGELFSTTDDENCVLRIEDEVLAGELTIQLE